MEETLRITFDDAETTKKKMDLTDFVEVSMKYIHLLKNVWLKYRHIPSAESFSGGALIEVTRDTVTLRNIRQNIFVLDKASHRFYCKKSNPMYMATKELIMEWQKLAAERKQLQLRYRDLEKFS